MHSLAARSWEHLAGESRRAPRRPGISLVTRDELDLLDELDLEAADLAEVLAVKAIFEGTIVGKTVPCPTPLP